MAEKQTAQFHPIQDGFIPNIKIIEQEGTNAYDLLKYKNVIFTASSIKSFQERVTK